MTTSSARFAVIKKTGMVIFAVITFLLVTVVIALSLAPSYNIMYYFNPLSSIDEAEFSINGEYQGTVKLPYTITDLNPGDEVTVYLQGSGNEQDNLLVEVDRAQLILYIEDEPYFSIGSPGTFPAFQKEPPRSIDIVALPNIAAGTELRLEFTLSEIAHSLDLQPFLSGDQNLITKQVLLENYLPLMLSLMMLVLGVTLSIIGLVFFSRAELAIVLFWLGLACIACGFWTFFANDVMLLFFSQFSVFYSISYIGLFILPIPLSRFCICFIRPYRSRILDAISFGLCAFFIAMMLSHISGFISFGEVQFFFRLFAPLLLTFYVALILVARQKGGALISPLFIFGIALFAVLGNLDATSGFLGIQSPAGMFFIVGMLFATIVIALLVWEYLSDALDAMEKNARLEADISAVNRSLDLQRKHFLDFTQNVEETRRMRHDLRHQLVAVQGFINERQYQEAVEYIDRLSKSMPSISDKLICDNVAVNSLAVHYIAQAEAEHILCDVKMAVPFVVGDIPDGDLSIIVGNLFENAIEACGYVEPEKRFIKVRSNVAANRFVLVIDNSFDGVLQLHGDEFYSRKRKGFGVGIASVRSVVAKYEGSMKYEVEAGVFKTSLYVKT